MVPGGGDLAIDVTALARLAASRSRVDQGAWGV